MFVIREQFRVEGSIANMAGSMTSRVVPAPGAMTSSSLPGMVPDRTTVPTHVDERVPAAASKERPLSQYGTAEEMSGVFRRKPMDQLAAADFEQANASFEELRKADPADLPPIRPLPPLGQPPAIESGSNTPALSTGKF